MISQHVYGDRYSVIDTFLVNQLKWNVNIHPFYVYFLYIYINKSFEYITFSVCCLVVPAAFPLALRAVSIGVTTARFSWSKLSTQEHSGFLSHYLLTLEKQDDEGGSIDFRVAPEDESYMINNLEPGTKYSIKIAVVSNVGRGEFSPPKIFRTKRGKRPLHT